MKSRELKKIYHPSLGRYVYEHRGNGLIVDNIMKPLKGAISSAASKAGRAVARAIGKKAKKAAVKATAKAEKSGDLIRRRLQSQMGTAKTPKTPKTLKTPRGRSRGRETKASAQDTGTKMSQNEVNALINNLIAQS